MNDWLMIPGMFLVTYLVRYLPFGLADSLRIPPKMEVALRFVPPVVLTAIVAPAVLMPQGDSIQLSLENPYLIGALVSFGIGWWRNNLLLTIVAGMLTFFAAQAFL